MKISQTQATLLVITGLVGIVLSSQTLIAPLNMIPTPGEYIGRYAASMTYILSVIALGVGTLNLLKNTK
jgi:hypothetical protein